MLRKLSKEQESLIPVIRDKWIRKLDDCNIIDRELATKQIEWLYSFSKLGKPTIIFLDSPLGGQIGANVLKGILGKNQVGDQVGDQVRAQVWAQVLAQIGDQVWDQVGDQVRDQVWDQVRDQVWDQVGDQVWDQVGDQVRAQVRAQVWAQIGDQVRAQVGDQVWDQELENFAWSNYGNIWDYRWCSFYDYFQQIGIKIKNKGFNQFISLLDSGIYDMIQLEKLCIVCAKPEYISRDENNRLHSEDGETIRWRDGFKLWFWHGICVPGELFICPQKINRENIAKENNAEVRRCYQEILGSERFAEILGVKEIDTDIDLQGNKMRLVETGKDELVGEKIKFADVICPSTQRRYFLCVPPNINNIWDAVAWTFGKKREEYKPIIET